MSQRPVMITPVGLVAMLVLGTLALPWLQLMPVDFERTAPLLAFGLPLVLGWLIWCDEIHLLLSSRKARLIALSLVTFSGLVTAHAAQPAAALVQVAQNSLLVLIALLAAGLQRHEPRTVRWLLWGLVGSGVIGVLTLAWPWIIHPDPRNAPAATFTWLYPNLRHAGLHLLAGAVVAPLLATQADTGRERWILLAAGALLATGLFWTGGRTPLIGVAAGALAAWLHIPQARRKTLMVSYTLTFSLGLAASTLLWTHDPSLGWWRAWHSTVAASGVNELSSYRLDIWQASARFVAESPWLGYGPDGYRFLNPKMDAQQPHNALVQWALAAGIPGMIAGVAGVLWLLTRRQTHPGSQSIIAALAAASLLDGTLYHVLCTSAFAIAAGLAASPLGIRLKPPPAPATNRAVLSAAALLLCILGLHAWLFNQLNQTEPPPPRSIQATILHYFPSTTFGFDRWLDAWAHTEPDLALAKARWAQTHSAYAWFYHLWSARTLARMGRIDEARHEVAAYERTKPGAFRAKLIQSVENP